MISVWGATCQQQVTDTTYFWLHSSSRAGDCSIKNRMIGTFLIMEMSLVQVQDGRSQRRSSSIPVEYISGVPAGRIRYRWSRTSGTLAASGSFIRFKGCHFRKAAMVVSTPIHVAYETEFFPWRRRGRGTEGDACPGGNFLRVCRYPDRCTGEVDGSRARSQTEIPDGSLNASASLQIPFSRAQATYQAASCCGRIGKGNCTADGSGDSGVMAWKRLSDGRHHWRVRSRRSPGDIVNAGEGGL